MNNKYVTKSLALSALSFPLAFLATKLTELFLKSSNPEKVDVTGGLAYLGYILIVGIVVALACWALALLFAIKAKKNNENSAGIKAAALVLVLVIACTMGGLLTNKAVDNVIDDARSRSVTPG